MPSKNSAQARAKKIKLVLFDVDGVLTDGKIWIFPAPAGAHQSTREHVASFEDKGGYGLLSQTMIEAKGFHAHKEVKKEAHIITEHAGGDGAARDAIEYILKAQGAWKRVVSEYIYERSPKKSISC